MIYLPRGIAVRQKVNPARINLPEAMAKLRVGTFTGYLRFDAPEGSGVIIFEKGKLVSALFVNHEETERLIAYDAIARIFEVSILGNSVLNIYRLSAELALGVHELLHGRYIYRGQDLKLINVQALLERIKAEGFTCCLRVYAPERTTLIFYEQGHALGFFHDGSADINVTADLAKSVALLPEAKIDLLETRSFENVVLADLMASVNLGPIWKRTRKLLLEERRKQEEAAVRSRELPLE